MIAESKARLTRWQRRCSRQVWDVDEMQSATDRGNIPFLNDWMEAVATPVKSRILPSEVCMYVVCYSVTFEQRVRVIFAHVEDSHTNRRTTRLEVEKKHGGSTLMLKADHSCSSGIPCCAQMHDCKAWPRKERLKGIKDTPSKNLQPNSGPRS